MWELVESYFNEFPVDSIQLISYNDFIQNRFKFLLESNGCVVLRNTHELQFYNPNFVLPYHIEFDGMKKHLLPAEMCERGESYLSEVMCSLKITNLKTGSVKTHENFLIGKVPVMVGSQLCNLTHSIGDKNNECDMNLGGYFIIKGSKKIVVAQERSDFNRISLFKNKAPYTIFAHIRSSATSKTHTSINNIGIEKNGLVTVTIPYITETVGVSVLFKALGTIDEKEMVDFIGIKDEEKREKVIEKLTKSFEFAHNFPNQESALFYIGVLLKGENKSTSSGKVLINFLNYEKSQKKKYSLKDVLKSFDDNNKIKEKIKELKKGGIKWTASQFNSVNDYVLSTIKYAYDHLYSDFFPTYKTDLEKKCYLGLALNKLFSGDDEDDRDNFSAKRVDMTGALMAQLLFTGLKKMITNLVKTIDKNKMEIEAINFSKVVKSKFITKTFTSALSTGNWGNATKVKSGVSQNYDQFNFIMRTNNLRRLTAPISVKGKVEKPRQLHGSHYGIICPSDTPEGKMVGLNKVFAMLSSVTVEKDCNNIKDIIFNFGCVRDLSNRKEDDIKIFINGCWVGNVEKEESKEIYESLKKMKLACDIDYDTSVVLDTTHGIIEVHTDQGRIIRPFLVVQDGVILYEKEREVQSANTSSNNTSPNNTSPKWTDLMEKGYIEFMDSKEMESEFTLWCESYDEFKELSIDQRKKYSHCEIHPATILGSAASTIPYPDRNQAPRNSYQCLWKEEEVLMSDKKYKKIKDIRVGDKIISVNPKTCERTISNVIHQYVKPTDKKIIKLTTLSGRSVVCTDDHLILTNNGWIEAGKITKGVDKVCIFQDISHQDTKGFSYIVMDENIFEEKCKMLGIKKNLIKTHINHLTKLNLLPLSSDSEKLPILSRILGFLLTDGSCGIYDNKPQIQLIFGSYDGCIDFVNDVTSLGYKQNKIIETAGGVNGATQHCWNVIYGNSLSTLMMTLGAILGKKTVVPTNPLPQWVKNGSLSVKREFLNGFQGGDGNKIKHSGKVIMMHALSKQKCKKYLDTLVSFFEELKVLFSDFGIKTKELKISTSKQYSDRYIVELPFENTSENLTRCFETISYCYDHHKTQGSLKSYEYCKYRMYETSKINILKKKVVQLKKEGKTYPNIAKTLNITESKANTYYRSRDMNSRLSNKNISQIDWMKNIEIKNDCFFVGIEKIEEHENVEIADITVDNEYHSLVLKSGIVVHNCNMCKQSVGIPYLNFRTMLCGTCHILHYGQKPIVSSKMAKHILKYDDMPTGINAICAICPFMGSNQEDSSVINMASVQRGLFHSSKYINYEEKLKKHKGEEWGIYKNEEKTNKIKFHKGTTDHLDGDFCVGKGEIVKKGYVLVGKISKNEDGSIEDKSLVLEDYDVAQVVCVQRGYDINNYETIKIQLVQVRIPQVGDKFASRIAQKSTVGKMVPQEDLPFSQDNFCSPVPDIILNPLAFLSRMTIGQIIEQFVGKKCCSTNKKGWGENEIYKYDKDHTQGNCTSFEKLNIETIKSCLKEFGYNPVGNEKMIDGMTGLPIDMMIFKGPVYFQRLKHMVQDKIHSRGRGPNQVLNRQPTEGKAKNGGLKIGEMERDCIISQGCSFLLKDRMADNSDGFSFHVCKICGLIAICNNQIKRYECMSCETKDIIEIKVTYGIKLVIQEFMALGICLRILVNETENTFSVYK